MVKNPRIAVVSALFALLATACSTVNEPKSVDLNGTNDVSVAAYGQLSSGELVSEYTLRNKNGIEVKVINYGGIITELHTPDKLGKFADVVLGYDSLGGYLKDTSYFGALIGRYGNRIGDATFAIDGVKYDVSMNDGDHHLHGGEKGFDKNIWQVAPFAKQGERGLTLTLFSPDGDQGYPGNLSVQVVYTLTDSDDLKIDYRAVTDKPTHVNLTQHSYFNMAGKGDVLDQELMIPADSITPVDSGLIPTGKLMSVAGTAFDFRTPTAIGARINQKDQQLEYGLGYDHNWVLNKSAPGAFELSARFRDPASGRVLEVYSDEPGIQFYSGNFLDGSTSGKGRVFEHRNGICLEPQHFPDTPNKPQFGSTLLRPGDIYTMHMKYSFRVD